MATIHHIVTAVFVQCDAILSQCKCTLTSERPHSYSSEVRNLIVWLQSHCEKDGVFCLRNLALNIASVRSSAKTLNALLSWSLAAVWPQRPRCNRNLTSAIFCVLICILHSRHIFFHMHAGVERKWSHTAFYRQALLAQFWNSFPLWRKITR